MGNLDPVSGNQDPNAGAGAGAGAGSDVGSGAVAAGGAAAGSSSPAGWKASLRTDLKDSPLSAKFEDTPDGLNKVVESYANLEKLLGHEKVPIPKDVNDVEGWNRFSKAMGIPDKAEGYGLTDVEFPKEWAGKGPDKNRFAEVVHAHKLTPAQAKGLWEAFTNNAMEGYKQTIEANKQGLMETVNKLKGEWGDAYQGNVELGQMVINKFSADNDMNDFITETLCKDPRGIKFLAKIGNQFAENKVGEFQNSRFTLAPEQAGSEIQKIIRDPNHAYNNPKASDAEHQAAVDYVNSLHAVVTKAKR